MKKLVVGMCALLSVALISCKEDEPAPPDIRLAAVGEYSGNAKFYYVDSGDLVYFPGEDQNTTFEVSVGTAEKTIKIEWNDINITGTKVEEASNGFTFDINSFTWDGISCNGYPGIELGTVEYEGLFVKASERLTFYFSYVLDGVTYVVEIEGDI